MGARSCAPRLSRSDRLSPAFLASSASSAADRTSALCPGEVCASAAEPVGAALEQVASGQALAPPECERPSRPYLDNRFPSGMVVCDQRPRDGGTIDIPTGPGDAANHLPTAVILDAFPVRVATGPDVAQRPGGASRMALPEVGSESLSRVLQAGRGGQSLGLGAAGSDEQT
jgi:hypothetical protein